MPEPLVEPTGQAVQERELPAGVAQQASLEGDGQSALGSLREGLQGLPPAKQEKTAAQSHDESQKSTDKKDFPPVGSSDIKEEKQVESRMDEPGEEGSALEGFRTDLIKARRKKEKAQRDKEEGKTESEDKTDKSAPVAADKTEGDDAPVTEDEVEKTINDPAISKRHQKRMIYLANKAKDLEKKLADAEAKPQTSATDEKIKELTAKQEAAEKELHQYQRRYSLESEPELKKFDEAATKADEAIYSKLKEHVSDKTIDLIKSMGGFDVFSRSNRTFTINVKENGEDVSKEVTASQLSRHWLDAMNVADSEYIKANLGERFKAIDAKKRRADELLAETDTWFKGKQAEQQKVLEEHQKTIKANQDAYQKWSEDWSAKQDWLKDKPVPSTATDEEKKEIENYNKGNAAVRVLLKAAANPTTVADYTSLVEQAASTQHYRRESTRLTKENESLHSQLKKIRDGITTTGKPGGGSIAKNKDKPKDESAAAQLSVPVVDSLREGMEALRNREA